MGLKSTANQPWYKLSVWNKIPYPLYPSPSFTVSWVCMSPFLTTVVNVPITLLTTVLSIPVTILNAVVRNVSPSLGDPTNVTSTASYRVILRYAVYFSGPSHLVGHGAGKCLISAFSHRKGGHTFSKHAQAMSWDKYLKLKILKLWPIALGRNSQRQRLLRSIWMKASTLHTGATLRLLIVCRRCSEQLIACGRHCRHRWPTDQKYDLITFWDVKF